MYCNKSSFITLTCLTWCQASSHCLIFFLASSSSLKRRARSALLVVEVRLLKTGDGLGEKLPLTKSQMLLAPPFKPRWVMCENQKTKHKSEKWVVALCVTGKFHLRATNKSEIETECLTLSAYPKSSGRRRWVFPAGHALAWLKCSKVDFAAILPRTAGTAKETGTGSLAGRWRVMTRN